MNIEEWQRRLRRQKKRLGEKKMPFPWDSAPHTRASFLKKSLTKNFLDIKFRWCGVFDAFSFEAIGPKKRLGEKKTPFSWGSAPHTRASFLKKA